MLALTDTTKLSSLSYTLAELQHTITVHLPQSDVVSTMLSPNSTHRIMQIPVGSKWSPGAHWHEDYVEHIKILKGVANVWINGQLQVLEAGDEAAFQLFDVHDFCRATLDSGEVLFIEEWTENGALFSPRSFVNQTNTSYPIRRRRYESGIFPQCVLYSSRYRGFRGPSVGLSSIFLSLRL